MSSVLRRVLRGRKTTPGCDSNLCALVRNHQAGSSVSFSALLCAIVLGGGGGVARAQDCARIVEDFSRGITCTGSGQVCDPAVVLNVDTCGVLAAEYFASPMNCSRVGVIIAVDGTVVHQSEALDPGKNTGEITLGPVAPGMHTLTFNGFGVLGGCNSGNLANWGGTFRVIRCGSAPTVSAPEGVSMCADGGAEFSVSAMGEGTIAYRWQVQSASGEWADLTDGTYADSDGQYEGSRSFEVSSADSPTVRVEHAEIEGDWAKQPVMLRCVATNNCGGQASPAASLIVVQPPVLTDQPVGINACFALAVSFAVHVTGTPPFTFQWRQNGEDLDMESADSSALVIDGAAVADIGSYDCVVTNACGSVISEAAELKMCPGDYNCDGGIDGADVGAYLADWEEAGEFVDFNDDGAVDGADVMAFFGYWENGC